MGNVSTNGKEGIKSQSGCEVFYFFLMLKGKMKKNYLTDDGLSPDQDLSNQTIFSQI